MGPYAPGTVLKVEKPVRRNPKTLRWQLGSHSELFFAEDSGKVVGVGCIPPRELQFVLAKEHNLGLPTPRGGVTVVV